MLQTFKAIVLILITTFTMGSVFGQNQNKLIEITDQNVRASLPGQSVSSAYLTIENKSSTPDRLISVSFTGAKEVQIHEMKMDGNNMMMRQLPSLEIPAKGKAELKPGGNHLMLMSLKEPIQNGQTIKMTLQFESAGKVEVDFPVRAMSGHMMH